MAATFELPSLQRCNSETVSPYLDIRNARRTLMRVVIRSSSVPGTIGGIHHLHAWVQNFRSVAAVHVRSSPASRAFSHACSSSLSPRTSKPLHPARDALLLMVAHARYNVQVARQWGRHTMPGDPNLQDQLHNPSSTIGLQWQPPTSACGTKPVRLVSSGQTKTMTSDGRFFKHYGLGLCVHDNGIWSAGNFPGNCQVRKAQEAELSQKL
ncbi:hypothetical protein DEU56DRAFT_761763 [Suillus clintonianus]|uniref:uncharacterized protein n=1 Tax=Suillus clintonianus TaxID=1904413 RepID=UPI001B86D862|nr:uncharacterized protein DEU56DRAFT_761763 [Suillus clintonianus]KAG2114857.1 hypothetical protein DEU56DRAFT_761763 [Suillus clintonianus]